MAIKNPEREHYSLRYVQYQYVSMDGITRELSVEVFGLPDIDDLVRQAPASTLSFRLYTVECCAVRIGDNTYSRQSGYQRFYGKTYMLNTVPFIGPYEAGREEYFAVVDATGRMHYLAPEYFELINNV